MTRHDFIQFSGTLVRTVRLMSRIKVTRRRLPASPPPVAPHRSTRSGNEWDVLLIGSSTGGPAALFKILSVLPRPFPFSVLIAQHIASGFSGALRNWLCGTGCDVCIPEDGEPLAVNRVYLAADDKHLVLDQTQRLRQVTNPGARYFPSVDMLFDSVASHFNGRVAAMVLTGMGVDGASGIRHLYEKGAFTLSEAESSCIIYGMPKAAYETGAICRVATLSEIVSLIQQLPHQSPTPVLSAVEGGKNTKGGNI